MKKIINILSSLCILAAVFAMGNVLAASPVFTFTPKTATTLQLTSIETATVQYEVRNQSRITHSLMMVPIPGVTQNTSAGYCPNPFVLAFNQSCILNLQIQGNQMPGNIFGGPEVCQQGPDGNPSPFLCNRPAPQDLLNITVTPVAQYTIVSSAGAGGIVSPMGTLNVNSGSSLAFTATPNANYYVYQWIVDGMVVQNGGAVFTLTNISANHQVLVNFSTIPPIFAGGQNGSVYYSFNNGSTWNATVPPASGSAVNALFLNQNLLYVGSANGFIYYSSNNGGNWNSTSAPDGSPINTVFLNGAVLYASTSNGLYRSFNNGASWSALTAPDPSSVTAFFATVNTLYSGTSNGSVYYSVDGGVSWTAFNTQPDGSAIRGIYVAANNVWVNTANEYVYQNGSLTGNGPWTLAAQTVFTLFVNSFGAIFAGTQGGYVYSVSAGEELGFITYTLINALFILG